jgi:hypothetical protein
VLLSHVLQEIHIPTTDVLDDVTNTGHQFCTLVRSLKQDPSPKTDVLYAISIIQDVSFELLSTVSNEIHTTSQIIGHQICALVQCLKLDPSPKTGVVHDIPNHIGRGFCAAV